MGKLDKLIEAKRPAIDIKFPDVRSVVASEVEHLASSAEVLSLRQMVTEAVAGIRKQIAAIPQTDLTPVHQSIASIPQPEKADYSPIMRAIGGIPRPDPVDFTQLLQKLDAILMAVREIDVTMPDVSVNVPKVEQVVAAPQKKRKFKHTITKYTPNGDPKEITSVEE